MLSGVLFKEWHDGITIAVCRNVIKMAPVYSDLTHTEGFHPCCCSCNRDYFGRERKRDREREREKERNLIKFKINRRNGDREYTWLVGATCL